MKRSQIIAHVLVESGPCSKHTLGKNKYIIIIMDTPIELAATNLVDLKVAMFLCSQKASVEESGEEKGLFDLSEILDKNELQLLLYDKTVYNKNSYGEISLMLHCVYLELNAIMKSYRRVEKDMREINVLRAFIEVEMPLVRLLTMMELHGTCLDVDKMNTCHYIIENEIKNVTKKAFNLSGEEINLASPEQVSHLLYDVMNVPTPKYLNDSAVYCDGGRDTGQW